MTVFHQLHVSKHLEFCQNLRVVFSSLFSVFGYTNETLSLMFDILHEGHRALSTNCLIFLSSSLTVAKEIDHILV